MTPPGTLRIDVNDFYLPAESGTMRANVLDAANYHVLRRQR